MQALHTISSDYYVVLSCAHLQLGNPTTYSLSHKLFDSITLYSFVFLKTFSLGYYEYTQVMCVDRLYCL